MIGKIRNKSSEGNTKLLLLPSTEMLWDTSHFSNVQVTINLEKIIKTNASTSEITTIVYTKKKYDFTKFKKLRIKGSVSLGKGADGNTKYMYYGYGANLGTAINYWTSWEFVNQPPFTEGTFDLTTDISDKTGEKYVMFWATGANFEIDFVELS